MDKTNNVIPNINITSPANEQNIEQKLDSKISNALRRITSSKSLTSDARKLVFIPEDDLIIKTNDNLNANDDLASKGHKKNFSFSELDCKKTIPKVDSSSVINSSNVDLEWDKHKDFTLFVESDTMSTYDLNERLAELVKQNFLDFEVMSNASIKSSQIPTIENNDNTFVFDDLMNDACLNCPSSENLNLNDENLSIQILNKKKLLAKRLRRLTNSSNSSNISGLLSNSSFQIDGTNASIFSDVHSNAFTPADCFTMEDIFRIKFINLQQALNSPSQNEQDKFLNSESFADLKPLTTTMLYAPISFDVESLYASIDGNKRYSNIKNDIDFEKKVNSSNINYYHSMPDLRLFSSDAFKYNEISSSLKSIQLPSKHLSLLDIRSFELIYIKNKAQQDLIRNDRDSILKNLKLDLKLKFSTVPPVISLNANTGSNLKTPTKTDNNIPDSDEEDEIYEEKEVGTQTDIEYKKLRKISLSGSNVNFSRMSRLDMLRSYMSKISERVKQIVLNTFTANSNDVKTSYSTLSENSVACSFNNSKGINSYLYSINEETVETYDVIEEEDILETPGILNEEINNTEFYSNKINSNEKKLNNSPLNEKTFH